MAVLGLVGTTVLVATPSAQAAPVLTPLVTDSFATATTTSPNWKTVTAPGSSTPCLTAGDTPSASPIGGCGTAGRGVRPWADVRCGTMAG